MDKKLTEKRIGNTYYRVSVKAKIRQGNKIILVKEDGKKWDLPGGGIEHGETITEALARELREEIGLEEIKYITHPRLFKMIDKAANRPLLFIVFEFDVADDIELLPSVENVETGLFELSDIPEVVEYSDDYAKYIKDSF